MLELKGRLRPFEAEGFDLFFGIKGWGESDRAWYYTTTGISMSYRVGRFSILALYRG